MCDSCLVFTFHSKPSTTLFRCHGGLCFPHNSPTTLQAQGTRTPAVSLACFLLDGAKNVLHITCCSAFDGSSHLAILLKTVYLRGEVLEMFPVSSLSLSMYHVYVYDRYTASYLNSICNKTNSKTKGKAWHDWPLD